jgi:WD40 repeat protein
MKAGLRRRSMAVIVGTLALAAALTVLAIVGIPSMMTRIVSGKESTLAGHKAAVSAVAFSPDGKMLASGSLDRTILLWDLATGQPIRTMELSDQAYSLVFYPDGDALLVGGQSGITSIWSTQTGEELFKQESLPSGQIGVAIAPDQSAYAIASRDAAVAFMDAKAYTWVKALTYPSQVWSLAYSPDGAVLAAGLSDGTLSLRDSQTDEELYALKGQAGAIKSLAFSPDGKLLASASVDKTIVLWGTETGEKLFTLSQHGGPVSSVAWSPDGKRLASASDDGSIILWNAATGEVADTLDGQGDAIYSVAFNADGTLLASGMQDGTVVLWKVD